MMKLSEKQQNTLKNHAKSLGRTVQVYFLGVALGWAAYPLLLALLARYMMLDVPMAIYSFIVTVIFSVMLMTSADEWGLTDRKPYKWARYKAKGFVIGGIAGLMIVILELVIILVADSVFKVSHPQFDIEGVNNYLRMAIYSPFFWFYELVNKGTTVIPRVTVLGSLIVIPFTSLFSGIGYLMGINGVDIDLKRKKRKEE